MEISEKLLSELRALAAEAKDAKIKPKILIVEDCSDDAILLRAPLLKLSCEVQIVDNPVDAINLLTVQSFRLVFIDLKLAGGDGVGVLKYLKENKPHIPTIIVSGHLSGEVFERAKKFGYFGIIEKPLSLTTLEQIFIQHNIPVL